MSDHDAYVAALPRRQAHAMHALFVATAELHMPPTAAEVCLYDEEAFSVRGTAAALREAAKRGLCICAGGYWFVTGALPMGHYPFERRWVRDTPSTDDDSGAVRASADPARRP